MRIDFAERQALYARARRERAEAVHSLLIAPLVRFFTRRPAKAARSRTRARHAHA